MSDTVQLLLTREEAAALLLMIALGTDGYEGNTPNPEIIERLDHQVRPVHLKTLAQKLNTLAEQVEAE